MNPYLELGISFNDNFATIFHDNTIIPILYTLYTSYTSENGQYNFTKTKNDIENCPGFTKEQIYHFNTYLTYLAICKYPLDKCAIINIITSEYDQTKHHINIKNNTEGGNKIMNINYKPKFFGNIWKQHLMCILSFLPFNIVYSTNNNGKFKVASFGNNQLGCKSDGRILNFINAVTFLNCFFHSIMASIDKNKLIINPINEIFYGFCRGLFGIMVSNVYPKYSNVLLNTIMIYLNFRAIKKYV